MFGSKISEGPWGYAGDLASPDRGGSSSSSISCNTSGDLGGEFVVADDDPEEACVSDAHRLLNTGRSRCLNWKLIWAGLGDAGIAIPPAIPPRGPLPVLGENREGEDWWWRSPVGFVSNVPGSLMVRPRWLGLRRGFCGGGGTMNAGDGGADIDFGVEALEGPSCPI